MDVMLNRLNSFSFTTIRRMSPQNPINIRIEHYPYERKNSPHLHDFPQLWYCIDGEFSISAGDENYHFSKGSLAIVPAGIEHIVFTKEEYAHVFAADIGYDLFLETETSEYLNAKNGLYMPNFTSRKDDRLCVISLSKASQELISNLFSELSVLSTVSSANIPAIRKTLEELFLLPELAVNAKKLQRTELFWQTKIVPVFRAMKYAHEHCTEKILIDDIIKQCAIGHTSFFSAFRKLTGMTFNSYVQVNRLRTCHGLMASTTYSIAYISAICGFSSQSHMERAYKKFSGILPKRARQHSREWGKYMAETNKL